MKYEQEARRAFSQTSCRKTKQARTPAVCLINHEVGMIHLELPNDSNAGKSLFRVTLSLK